MRNECWGGAKGVRRIGPLQSKPVIKYRVATVGRVMVGSVEEAIADSIDDWMWGKKGVSVSGCLINVRY